MSNKFNMNEFAHKLCDMPCRSQMKAAQETFEATGYDEFERITERNNLRDMEIEIEVSVRMKDVCAIEDIIAENPEIIAKIILKDANVRDKLRETIRSLMERDVEMKND